MNTTLPAELPKQGGRGSARSRAGSASLYLGRREGDKLLHAGKARSGYTETIARELREKLDPLIVRKRPLSEPIKKPKATWIEPDSVHFLPPWAIGTLSAPTCPMSRVIGHHSGNGRMADYRPNTG